MDLDQIGRTLQTLRTDDEGELIVSFGAHGPSYDCRNGHVSITIRKGNDEASGSAVGLGDALMIARWNLKQIAVRREKAKAKAANSEE